MSGKNTKNQGSLIVKNKKARHYYELMEFMEAGIVLTGTEIKSIRTSSVNFHDAYVTIQRGEAFLVGLHIAAYANAGYAVHKPDRDRKLLLHRRQIMYLAAKIEQKGMTIVPVDLHFSKGRVKVEIAVARGKKLHDHRETLKQSAALRDAEREMSRGI